MPDSEIRIRNATSDDADELLEWRNDPVTRSMSFDSSKVSRQAHQAWLSASLKNHYRHLFIGEYAGTKIGICRLDVNRSHAQAELSINMNPSCRGRGLATTFILKAIERYNVTVGNTQIIAKVKRNNIASIRLFTRAGFVETSRCDDKLCFVYPSVR